MIGRFDIDVDVVEQLVHLPKGAKIIDVSMPAERTMCVVVESAEIPHGTIDEPATLNPTLTRHPAVPEWFSWEWNVEAP